VKKQVDQILQAAPPISPWDYLIPDLIINKGKIITVDEDFSIVEALAVKDNRIVAVGKTEDILGLKGAKTKILDLQGKTVIPGLQDSHIHFMELGADLIYKINLAEARSVEEITNMVKEQVLKTEPGNWVLGVCWDWRKIQKEKQSAMADRLELDAVSPNNPVYLNYIEDGWVFNTLAMKKMAGMRAGSTGRKTLTGPISSATLKDSPLDLIKASLPAFFMELCPVTHYLRGYLQRLDRIRVLWNKTYSVSCGLRRKCYLVEWSLS
jgi:hypothetical protein